MTVNTKIQEIGALESGEGLEVVKHGNAVNVLQSTGLFVLCVGGVPPSSSLASPATIKC